MGAALAIGMTVAHATNKVSASTWDNKTSEQQQEPLYDMLTQTNLLTRLLLKKLSQANNGSLLL